MLLIHGPLPQLRGLALVIPPCAEAETIAPFSPIALGLHVEQLMLAGVDTFLPKQPFALPALTSLYWLQPGMENAWNIMAAARATLRSVLLAPIAISDALAQGTSVRGQSLVMPALEHLQVVFPGYDAAAWLATLKAPKLTLLALSAAVDPDAILPFLENVSPSVRVLQVQRDVQPDWLEAIATRLADVEVLSFTTPWGFRTGYTATDESFARLATPRLAPDGSRAWLLPKLSVIELTGDGTYKADNGDGIMELLRRRTGDHLDSNTTPRRLSKMTVVCRAVPSWLVAELGRRFQEH
ncbi:hypothetical protein AURDEDRAFT_116026 [Auricularia subglabra TFB-10046 SS5]|nr:hypothetical protein AURDEDRAFT_116026 [Auricularia subglabra TFB-10046 SS5]